MTKQEIYQKALQKAKDGGINYNLAMTLETFRDKVIFSHAFAKAFFGTYKIDLNHFCEIEIYKYHLAEMVKEEEPLEYLEAYMKKVGYIK